MPDDDVTGDFLDDTVHHGPTLGNHGEKARGKADSDDDDERDGNPMVAGFEDEVELDHFEPLYTEVNASSAIASPRIASPSVRGFFFREQK